MKQLVILLLVVILYFNGCASMGAKDVSAQDVISKSKIFCQRGQIEDMPLYDEAECYQFREQIIGINILSQGRNEIVGQLVDKNKWIASGTEYWIIMPNNRDLPLLKRGNFDLLYHELPVDLCVKRQGKAFYKGTRRFRGGDHPVIEIIEKKEINKQEIKRDLEEKYNTCKIQYNSILEKWQTAPNAKIFCNSILAEWQVRECQKPFTDECTNLAFPFIECYNNKFIKLNPQYVNAVF